MPDLLTEMAAVLALRVERLGDLFASPASRLSYISLLAALAFAALAYRIHYAGQGRLRLPDFLRFVFPKRVYGHGSFLIDVKILLFTRLLVPARILLFGFSAAVVASATAAVLGEIAGSPTTAALPGTATMLLLCLLLVLAYDFGTYWSHRLSHHVPVLWAFHRVHHSAEELNPLTVLRKHPVYDAFSGGIDAMLVGPIQGIIIYLWAPETATILTAQVNVAFGLFGFAASALRHSHIWLSFGPMVDRFFVSPALHQIHHSRAPQHWDRNYGEVFAIWDWMFGSLYLPQQREELRFGLGDEAEQPHPSLRRAMLEPFLFAWRKLRPQPPQRQDDLAPADGAAA